MVLFEPVITLFLLILTLGMSVLLFIMLQMPGRNPGKGKFLLSMHLACYFIALGWEVLSLFIDTPYPSRILLSSLYWAGPTLLFISLWAGRVMSVRQLILPFIILYILYLFILLFNKGMFSAFYKGLLINDLIMLIWIMANGTAGLLLLKSKSTEEIKVVKAILFVLLLSAFCWGVLTTFDHSLSLFWGHAYIIITLLLAQIIIALYKKNNQKRDDTPDIKAIGRSYNLTKREIEVVTLLTSGAGNKDIAYSLGISEHTVKRHLNNLFKKCSVFSRFELTAFFMGWKGTDTKV